jgi:hypothetical protein
MFGNGVGSRPDFGQQSGGRRRDNKRSTTLFDHLWDCRPRQIDVGHQIDVPKSRPIRVRGLKSTFGRDAGIGNDDINLTEFRSRSLNDRLDLGFVGDVTSERNGTDFGRRALGCGEIAVGNNDSAGIFFLNPLADGTSDAICTSRHQDDSTAEFH